MNEYLQVKIAVLAAKYILALYVSSIFNARVNQNMFTVENDATSSESKVSDDKQTAARLLVLSVNRRDRN